MKRVKSFEFRPGYGQGIEVLDQEVNEFIKGLEKAGVSKFELIISSTDKVIVYTLVWDRQ